MNLCVHQFYTFKCCIGFGRGITPAAAQTSPVRRANSPDHPNPALAITENPSPAITRIGWALRALLLTDSSSCLKDRKVSNTFYSVELKTTTPQENIFNVGWQNNADNRKYVDIHGEKRNARTKI